MSEQETKAIEVKHIGDAPSGDDPLAIIEQRGKLLDRVLDVAIKATHPGMWVSMGDKPWPTGPAAESMARRCAVSWEDVESVKRWDEDDKGRYYVWTYSARFFLPGGRDSIQAEGHCSSRDQFLGTETRETRPLSGVDEGSIQQAAYTNLVVNGVCRLLGVRNLSWERLEGILGVKRDAFAAVAYRTGAKGGGRESEPAEEVLRFGRGKDKTLSQVSEDDLRWYISVWEKDLADPEKEKFHARTRAQLAAAQKILAAKTASPWERIQEIGKAHGEEVDALKKITAKLTGKKSTGELTAEDVAKVSAFFAQSKPSGEAL